MTFGTGYSALTYLNRFPLDSVKMDRGFLRDIEDSSSAAGIASAVVSMSHSLDLKVVAEGVDSPQQAELLRSMGCDEIQGFLFSAAIPSEEATRFLASDNGQRPVVTPILESNASPPITGEETLDSTQDEGPVSDATCDTEEILCPTAPPRVMVIDAATPTLGPTAHRMMRLDADVHLVAGLEEADHFFEEEEPILDLVIAPPEIELAGLFELVEKIKKRATDHVPRLLVAGIEPKPERRAEIRDAGADWVLWEPFADPELRFFVNAARSNRNWKFQRQSVRVPIETIAWIRAGGQRGVRAC